MKHPKHYDTDEATSKRMARVKLKHGDAETAIAKILWHDGYRYWLNYKKIPGSDWENRKPKLKRNREYWIEKIEENIARDRRVDQELYARGWTPIHFWSKDVKKDLSGCVQAIKELIFDLQLQDEE